MCVPSPKQFEFYPHEIYLKREPKISANCKVLTLRRFRAIIFVAEYGKAQKGSFCYHAYLNAQRLIGLNFVNDHYVIVKKSMNVARRLAATNVSGNLLFFSAYHHVKRLSKMKQFASASV